MPFPITDWNASATDEGKLMTLHDRFGIGTIEDLLRLAQHALNTLPEEELRNVLKESRGLRVDSGYINQTANQLNIFLEGAECTLPYELFIEPGMVGDK